MKKNIETHQKMSLGMKGIALLVIFTVFLCCKRGDVLALFIAIPVILLLFMLDVFFIKKRNYYEIRLKEVSDCDTKMNTDMPIVFYLFCMILIVVRIAMLTTGS